MRRSSLKVALLFILQLTLVSSFNIVLMARRGKGNLKKRIEGTDSSSKSGGEGKNLNSLNQGRGQEITGVSLPAEGSVKGWEFGEKQTVACANVDGNFYALQGSCPRCAFDLFKGDIVTDEAFGPDQPRLACPTCATTFSLKTGKHGAALKRTGLAGFVGGLAKTATVNDASADAKAFVITREKESGRVFCKER